MHAIAMVHKMQRLALSSSNSMDIDDKRYDAIQEEEVDEGSIFKQKQVCVPCSRLASSVCT